MSGVPPRAPPCHNIQPGTGDRKNPIFCSNVTYRPDGPPNAVGLGTAGVLRMARHTIGTDWSLIVDAEFRREVHDGDVMLWVPGRTIHASVFNTGNAEAEE